MRKAYKQEGCTVSVEVDDIKEQSLVQVETYGEEHMARCVFKSLSWTRSGHALEASAALIYLQGSPDEDVGPFCVLCCLGSAVFYSAAEDTSE